MAKMLRTVVIDPYARTVYEREIEDNLSAYYEVIGCQLVEPFYPFTDSGHHFIYVDEEGLMGGQSCGFAMGEHYKVMGRGIVLREGPQGSTLGATISAEHVRALITGWLGDPDIDVDELVEGEILHSNPLFGHFG